MKGVGGRGFGCALGLAIVATAPVALGEPGAATRLVYARARGVKHCPDQAALRAAVSRRLGYDPFVAAARQTVVVDIAPEGAVLIGRVRLLNDDGVVQGARELRAGESDCEELSASLALAISITLDPAAALESTGEAPASTDSNAPAAAPSDSSGEDVNSAVSAAASQPNAVQIAVTPAAPARDMAKSDAAGQPRGRRLGGALRAGALAAVGVAPAPNVGLWGGFGFQYRALRLNLEGRADRAASTAPSPDGSVESALYTGMLSGCFVHAWAHYCAITALGWRSVKGAGVPSARSDGAFYVAVGARFEGRAAVGRDFALLANVEAVGVLTPLTLRIGETELWSSAPVALALNLGAEFSL